MPVDDDCGGGDEHQGADDESEPHDFDLVSLGDAAAYESGDEGTDGDRDEVDAGYGYGDQHDGECDYYAL